MQPILQVKGVSKRYGQFTAVRDVSLDIAPGSFTSLLGPSGCGKTTLLRLIAGLLAPDSGSILLNGHAITHLPPYERDMTMVFQSYALFPHLTVAGNVAFGLEMHRVPSAERRHRVADALALVGLGDLGHRFIHQLSGGQQQRVALARALVLTPALLLLDEPLSNLDAKIRQQTRLELKAIQERLGLTMLYVTHDQEEALALSDDVILLSQGCIVQRAHPRMLYERPNSRFAADFVGDGTLLTVVAKADSPSGEPRLETTTGLILKHEIPEGMMPSPPFDVLIRPEQVVMNPEGLPNVFEGVVVSSAYEGETLRYTVRIGDQQVKGALTLSPSVPIPPVGDHITVGWTCEAVHAVPTDMPTGQPEEDRV